MATYKLDKSIHSENVIKVHKYNFFGNTGDFRVVPLNWLSHITFPRSDKPNSMACLILAEIVYRYRPEIDTDENTGKVLPMRKRFKGEMLQKSYKQLMILFGITKMEAKRYCKKLEELDLIKIHFETYRGPNSAGEHVVYPNTMYIEIFPEEIARITFNKREVSTKKLIPTQESIPTQKLISTSEQPPSPPKSRYDVTPRVDTITKNTNTKNTNTKNLKKDKQKTPNKQTVTSPEIKITFPLIFETKILHTDKALIGQPVIIKRGDEITEANFFKATPKRITAYPLGGGPPIIINSTSKADIAYLNGKVSQVIWAKPEQAEPNMHPNQKAIYDELIETIDKDIVAASNYKLFSEVKNYAIIVDKSNIFTSGYLSDFNRWYYDIHTEWQASPSSITLKTIQTNIGAYKRWVSRGKQIPKKNGIMEGLKTPQVAMEVVTMTEQEMLGLDPGEEVDLSKFEWGNDD